MQPAFQNAFLGSLVADAVAMPVHWYYDTAALDRDYGAVTTYLAPRNPHPDSILWRSHYRPRNPQADILHGQAQYWGRRGIHYHQFLSEGENTLNFRLAIELYRQVIETGGYDADAWLHTYIQLLQTPGWHNDTYIEECHRGFFTNLANEKSPRRCAVHDKHIGGLAAVPALIAGLDALSDPGLEMTEGAAREHVGLTHASREVDQAALTLTRMLFGLAEGKGLREVIIDHGKGWIGRTQLEQLERLEDREIIGMRLPRTCYLPGSFTASLALTWKYHDSFSGGVSANAFCGGDSCHRGAVVGPLLAASNGIPETWLRGLASMERLRCDIH